MGRRRWLLNLVMPCMILLSVGIAFGQELPDAIHEDAVVVSDGDVSPEQDYLGVLTGKSAHQVGPEYCWRGSEWLRPFAPCPQRGWKASIEMLILSRSDPNDLTLVRDATTGDELLNASDLSFSGELGPRFRIQGPLGRRWAFEFGIFGVDGWRAQALIPGPQLLRLSGPPDANEFALATSPLIDQRSTLGSQEFNLRREVNNRLSVLGGFRSLQLEEWFSTSTFLTRIYEVSTDNRLYGFQLGADWQLVRNSRIEIAGFVRAGIFNNDAVAETADPSGIFAFAPQNQLLSANAQRAAFAGEAGITGSIRLWDFVWLRGGYQVLHVDSVALTPDQLPLNEFAVINAPLQARAGIDANGDVFYHGATAGLEVRW
ncbi:MAG: hypothetical protein SGJ19_21525 [Planctomycetia bacterium]|nr:hypothetical protein [Planctomycetia bacterium]